MKTLRLFGMLLMAVTLSFGISACGGDDDDDGENGTQTSDPNVQSVVGSWNVVYYTSIRRYNDGRPDEQKVHNETPPYDRVVFYQDGRCEYWEYDGDSDYQGTARYRVDSDGNQYHEDGSFTYTQNGTNITCKSNNSDNIITIKNYDGKNKMLYEWNIHDVKGYKYYTGELERVIGSSAGTSDNYSSGDDTTNMCPDGNHPHMIDLGLPSGTKWACCNLGATKPDGYGNFYAWGETNTKSEYSWETYMYGSSEDSTVYIGNDIAGTQYDAATVNWGGLWRMPSLAQCQELIDNTTYEWTTLNGVKGGKFTAKNGKSIFLPASGLWWNTGLDFVGNNAEYLSSTINKTQSIGTYAYAIYIQSIDEGYGMSDYQTLSDGASVRPVQGGNNGGGTVSNETINYPETVSYIYDLVSSMERDVVSDRNYCVKGKVCSIKYPFSAEYGTAVFNISDNGYTGNKEFTVYSTYYKSFGQKWVTGNTQVAVGDEVVVFGKVVNYKGMTPEFAEKQSYVVSINGK